MNKPIGLLAPALLFSTGCHACLSHNVQLLELIADGAFPTTTVSGLPAGKSSLFFDGRSLTLDGDGHAASEQEPALLALSLSPDWDDLLAVFDLTALANDLTSLGADLRSADSAAALDGKSYPLTADAFVELTLDDPPSGLGTGTATVVAGTRTGESFALDLDLTIPTGQSTAIQIAGVTSWAANTIDFTRQTGSCPN